MRNMNLIRLSLAVCLSAGLAGIFPAQADGDQPFKVRATQADEFETAIAASVAQAKMTLDDAVARYYAGMQEKARFFCTVRLADEQGRVEQVYIEIDKWDRRIQGRISNTIHYLQGFAKGQTVVFDEGDILDWTIRHNDGHEEGNFIGKLLAARQTQKAVR